MLKTTIAGAFSILILVFTYVGGDLFPYIDPDTGEPFFDEDNLSFQPFSFFVPEDTETIDVDVHLQEHLGEIQYIFFPEGLLAYVSGYKTLPVWAVSLYGPQFPKSSFPEGVTVMFRLTDFIGMTATMNSINHYIGMLPMEAGAPLLRKLVPLIYLLLIASILIGLFYNGRFWWVFLAAPALMPVYFLGVYYVMLYWFGHNLSDYAAFDIGEFTPTLFGEGTVANFTTLSRPVVGYYFMLLFMASLSLTLFFKFSALKKYTR